MLTIDELYDDFNESFFGEHPDQATQEILQKALLNNERASNPSVPRDRRVQNSQNAESPNVEHRAITSQFDGPPTRRNSAVTEMRTRFNATDEQIFAKVEVKLAIRTEQHFSTWNGGASRPGSFFESLGVLLKTIPWIPFRIG